MSEDQYLKASSSVPSYSGSTIRGDKFNKEEIIPSGKFI